MYAQPCDRRIGSDPALRRKAPDGLPYGPLGQTFLQHLLGSEHILLVPLSCNNLRGRYYLHFQVGTLRHRRVKRHAPGSYSKFMAEPGLEHCILASKPQASLEEDGVWLSSVVLDGTYSSRINRC